MKKIKKVRVFFLSLLITKSIQVSFWNLPLLNINSVDTVFGKNIDKIHIKEKCKGKKLKDEDFIIWYKNYKISFMMDVEDLFKKIGTGDVNESNNYGFIGYSDDNQYKYFNHNYLTKGEGISLITKMDIVTGEVNINKINLFHIATSDGISTGSSKKEVLCIYGTPKVEKKDKIKYEFNNKELIFNFKNSKVSYITMINNG